MSRDQGQSWQVISPGPDHQQPRAPGLRRGTDHPRQHRRRGLQHPLLVRGVTAHARGTVGGQRRRPGPHLPRPRRYVDRDHPRGHAGGRHRQRHRDVLPRSGPGVHRGVPLPGERLPALHLPDQRFGAELGPADRRNERDPADALHPRHPRGPRPQGTALRGNRVRALCLVRRRRPLAALPEQPAGKPDHRHAGAPERPGGLDPGPVLLGARRPEPAPPDHRRDDGRGLRALCPPDRLSGRLRRRGRHSIPPQGTARVGDHAGDPGLGRQLAAEGHRAAGGGASDRARLAVRGLLRRGPGRSSPGRGGTQCVPVEPAQRRHPAPRGGGPLGRHAGTLGGPGDLRGSPDGRGGDPHAAARGGDESEPLLHRRGPRGAAGTRRDRRRRDHEALRCAEPAP